MFLDKLLMRRIDTEIDWLRSLWQATEGWYNQLTTPVLPILIGEVDPMNPDVEEKYNEIENNILKEVFIINAGDKI